MTTKHGSFDRSSHRFYVRSPHGFRNGGISDPDYYYIVSGSPWRVVKRSGTGASTVLLSVDLSTAYMGLAVDPDENIYVRRTNGNVEKYSSDGTLIWTSSIPDVATTSQFSNSIEVDFERNVYTVTARSGTAVGSEVTKLDPDGNFLFSLESGGAFGAIAVDQDGNLYYSIGTSLRKADPSGATIWTVSHGASVDGCAVDEDGNVYLCGAVTGGVSIRRFDSAGNETLTLDHGGTAIAIDCDNAGNIYVVGVPVSSVVLRKYNQAGIEQWNKTDISTHTRVRVDQNLNVHTSPDNGPQLHTKYDRNGNIVATFDDLTNVARGTAVNFGRYGAFGFLT